MQSVSALRTAAEHVSVSAPRIAVEELLTGERLQALADVTIITDAIAQFHASLPKQIRVVQFHGGMDTIDLAGSGGMFRDMGARRRLATMHRNSRRIRRNWPLSRWRPGKDPSRPTLPPRSSSMSSSRRPSRTPKRCHMQSMACDATCGIRSAEYSSSPPLTLRFGR